MSNPAKHSERPPTPTMFLIVMVLGGILEGFSPQVYAARELTLAQALELASRHNPTIQASREEVKTSDAQLEIARGAFFPKVNATGTYINTNQPSQAFGILLDQGRFTAADFAIDSLNNPGLTENFQSGVSLSQPIFNGGREFLGLQLAKMGQTVSTFGLEDTQQRTLFEVTTAYYALTLAKQNLTIAKESIAIAKANLGRIVARYREGMAVKSEVLQARVRLAAHQENLIRAQRRLDVAHVSLSQAIGIDEKIDATEPLRAGSVPNTDPQHLLALAIERRPDYRRLTVELQRADMKVSMAQSAYLPNVNLQARYELNNAAPFSPNGSNNYSVFGTVSINLFNGLTDAANVRKTKAQMEKARRLLEAKRRRIEVEIAEAASQVAAANERLLVTQEAIDQAEENLRIIRNRYESGIAPVLDLFTAELTFRQAKLNRLQALYDFRISQARLGLVTGEFDGGQG